MHSQADWRNRVDELADLHRQKRQIEQRIQELREEHETIKATLSLFIGEMRASVGWRKLWLLCLPAVQRLRRRSSPSLDGRDCGAARRLGRSLGKPIRLGQQKVGGRFSQRVDIKNCGAVWGRGRCAFRPRAPRDACVYPGFEND